MDTISQVVAKEPIWVPYPETSSSLDQSSKRPFLCTHILTGLNLKQAGPELTLHNIPKHDVTKIGVWVSSERLTRSHPSFKLWAPKMEDESGLLIGCLYDLLYCDNNPINSKSEYGGFLDGIEMKEDMTVEFGVEGNWLSEYVPASDAEFYYMKNGVKSSGKLAEDMPYLKPCGSMYPLVSVVSKTENMAIMPPFIQPPKELSERWQKEDRWIEKSFTENCLIDRNGILTYTPSYKSFPGGQFRGRSLAFEEHREFQVEIINLPTDDSPVELAIGLTAERDENQHYIVSISATLDPVSKGVSVSSTCIQSIHDGSTKNVTLMDVGFKVGDVFKVKWMPLSSDGKNEVSFYAGAQKLVTVDVEFPTDQNIMPLVSFKCQDNTSVVKLLNYRPNYRAPAPLRNKITLGRAHYCNVMDDGQIIYKTNVDKESGSTTYFGHFISKTPFNRELLEFSVKVMEMDDGRLFGIGISEPDVTTKEVFIGWLPGTVGYHADNGQYTLAFYHSEFTLAFTTQ
ncbi:hypothetical protein DPMN_182582 [Dreissena polymorpha]|uniref:Uncharacterized protein n=1 Tax=Dreissena polymorpha TaxID=45954 RepID=A0A9D4DGS1_DREPO|nr:hypothetical protein DPMN_182582 [Dreissena polymorpha]